MPLDILKELLSDQFDVDPGEITWATNVYEDLGADSLDMVELAMACEEEFDLEIPDCRETWALSTVADIIQYIEAHKN